MTAIHISCFSLPTLLLYPFLFAFLFILYLSFLFFSQNINVLIFLNDSLHSLQLDKPISLTVAFTALLVRIYNLKYRSCRFRSYIARILKRFS